MTIKIEKVNDVYIRIHCESDVAQELSEYFTFFVPGAKFTPAYRNKYWDGKIRLFNTLSKTIYAGLKLYVEIFAREREYDIEYTSDFADEEFSLVEASKAAKLYTKFEPRDYQLEAFAHAVRTKRCLLLSPTASGKSLIIYLLSRHFASKEKKTLIVVPTTSLVHQMASDFVEYGCPEKYVHKIFSGQDKITNAPFVITTWQSIYDLPKTWFEQFHMCVGDEAHLFKSKSLTSIMSKLLDCPYKFGFTGTLDGTQTHKLVLEGLFGAVKKVTTTSELIEQKHLAEFKIKAIVLNYSDEVKQKLKNATYQEEIDYIVSNHERNKFIMNLALSLKGNTLILFNLVERHGKVLKDMFGEPEGKELVFIHGEVDGLVREEYRQQAEKQDNMILLASYGTYSTGVNIKNLHNIIFASPSKSRIRNLQSIGRGLRKGNGKSAAVLYDIADDLSWKSRKNHTILHLAERIKIYNEEKFDYKLYNVKLRS